MKINSLNRIGLLTLAFSLTASHASWAQTNVTTTQPANIPTAIAPVQPTAAANDTGMAQPPLTGSDANKQVPSPDSVLTKLKENASPVSINDMIAAQDVLTRLDLISQIEEKMAKIDDARNKHPQNMPAPAPAPTPLSASGPAAGAQPVESNAAALATLSQATSQRMPPMNNYGGAQVLTIVGTDGDYSALLQVDGHQLNVKNGSTVPGLGTVTSINPKQIVVSKPNGKTTNLSFTQN